MLFGGELIELPQAQLVSMERIRVLGRTSVSVGVHKYVGGGYHHVCIFRRGGSLKCVVEERVNVLNVVQEWVNVLSRHLFPRFSSSHWDFFKLSGFFSQYSLFDHDFKLWAGILKGELRVRRHIIGLEPREVGR